MQGTQLAGQTSMDLANLAQLEQQQGLRGITALEGIGSRQRALQQAGLDIGYEDYLKEQAYPYEQLQFASGLTYPVGGLMAGSTNTQTTTQKGGNGLLSAALGIGSMALGIPGVGAALGGGLGGLGFGLGMGSGTAQFMSSIIPSFGQGYLGLGPSTVMRNRGGVIPGYNKGGVVQKYQDGGIIGGIGEALNERFRGLRRVTPDAQVTQEYPITLDDGTQILRDGTEIVIDEPLYPGGPTRIEYLDMLEQLQAGDMEMPQDLDEAPDESFKMNDSSVDVSPDEDIMVRLLAGEARGEPLKGQIAIANVVRNRAKEKGKSIREIALQDKQFSTFNKDDPNYEFQRNLKPSDPLYQKLLNNVVRGAYKDPTGGATHYYNPELADPEWATALNDIKVIGAHKFGKTKYQRGGEVLSPIAASRTMSPFRRMLQENVVNPFQTGASNLELAQMLQTRDMASRAGGLGDYFFTPEAEVQKTSRTPLLDSLVEDKRLANMSDKLSRGQLPSGLQKAMSQVRPLAERGGFEQVTLGNDGRTLMVKPIAQQLQQQVAKVAGTPTATPSQAPKQRQMAASSTSPLEQASQFRQSTTPKESGFNMPLISLGAAILSGRDDDLGTIGRGVLTAVTSKKAEQQAYAETQREQAKMALELMKANLYGKQVQASIDKANDPYSRRLQELRMQKLEKDLSGETTLERQRATLAETLLKNDPSLSVEEAWANASQAVGLTGSATGGSDVQSYIDFFGMSE
jgi:hypothetical protein